MFGNTKSKIMLKQAQFYLLICFVVCAFYAGGNKLEKPSKVINAVLGEVAFLQAYGYLPHGNENEMERIQLHLRYVENLLRRKDVSGMPLELQEKRLQMLNRLCEYRERAEFPTNYAYPGQRVPCFIDYKGNICAVGYLVEQSAGRAVAEKINEKYQYANIKEMQDPMVQNWIASSGLSEEECAMIQPAYSYPYYYPYYYQRNAPPEYVGLTSILTGVNVGFTTLNILDNKRGDAKLTLPIISVVTGTLQMASGILGLGSYHDNSMSFVNITSGIFTHIIAVYSIAHPSRYRKPSNVRVSAFSQAQSGTMFTGLNLVKRF